jgi:hypothetical protein
LAALKSELFTPFPHFLPALDPNSKDPAQVTKAGRPESPLQTPPQAKSLSQCFSYKNQQKTKSYFLKFGDDTLLIMADFPDEGIIAAHFKELDSDKNGLLSLD